MSAIEIPEAGSITVNMPGGAATIDAYDCWNAVDQIRSRIADDDTKSIRDFHEGVAAFLVTKGLPPLNAYQVDQFVDQLGKAVVALGELAGQKPA